MFELVLIVLFALWLLGFVFVPVAGSLIHILLVVVVVLWLVRALRGRSVL